MRAPAAEENPHKKDHFIYVMAWLAVLLGFDFGGFQFALLKMAEEFGITKTVMGSMVSVFFAALTIAPVLTGGISDRKGKKPVHILGLLTIAAGSLICLLSSSIIILFIGIGVMGFGTGTLESTVTAALSDHDLEKAGKNVSLIQGILSAGCCVIPLLLNFAALRFGSGWRFLYIICLTFSLVSLIPVIKTRFTAPSGTGSASSAGKEKTTGSQYKHILKNKTAVFLIICVFIYIFMENGVSYFADTFFSLDLGRGDCSAIALALFWLGMAISRFASAAAYRYEDRIMTIGFSAAVIFLVLLFFLRWIPGVMLIYFLTGLAFAPLWPFLAGRLNRSFPESTGAVSGIVLAMGGLGGMISPYMMGVFADHFRVAAGFLATAALTAAGLILYLLSRRK